ncbi:hypothetical protein [Enterococcus lactis]|uniref:hypothetical protein n=1 Tax=Enterococcus lactis TaxID=357441 RepID=UPI0024127B26|nr:hypothetical protein [Enterococcus lactis]
MSCLNCGSKKVAPLQFGDSDKFMLNGYNTRTRNVNIGNGLVVSIIACGNCGYLHLLNE